MGCAPEQAALSDSESVSREQSYTIVCTTGMVADVVRNIVGEHAVVQTLIPTGVDPHLYQATREDVLALSAAQIIFYNGLYLEGKMIPSLNAMAAKGRVVVPLAERAVVSAQYIEDNHETDPHLWMDVALWSQVAVTIAQTLSEYDASRSTEFQANLDLYMGNSRANSAQSANILENKSINPTQPDYPCYERPPLPSSFRLATHRNQLAPTQPLQKHHELFSLDDAPS